MLRAKLLMYFVIAGVAASLAIPMICRAQEPAKLTPPPGGVIRNEVDRLGDRMAVVGERDIKPIGSGPVPGYSLSGGNAFETNYTNAMSTPADDSDQWLLALWGPSSDPATQQWFKLFETDEHLTPFVAPDPSNNGKAWAHWNFYRADDGTQLWRFRDYKINPSEMPCVTLNPPRNGHFGNPIIVVDAFDLKSMTPAAVQKRIQRSVKAWTDNLQISARPPTKDGAGSQWNSLQQNPYGSQTQSPAEFWNQQIAQCRPNDPNCNPMNRIPPPQVFDPKFPLNGPGGGGLFYFLERNATTIVLCAIGLVFLLLYLKNNPDTFKSSKPQSPKATPPAATQADLQAQIDALKAVVEAAPKT